MSLSRLFTDNYEYLNTVAKRITRGRNVKMAPELINSTYLTLFEKDVQVPGNNEEFVKWFSKCMKNYFTWPNSEFNRAQKLDVNEKERKTEYNYEWSQGPEYSGKSEDNFKGEINTNPLGIEGVIDEDALRNIELGVEQVNDFTREIIEISSNLGKNKTLRYIELVEFKRTLPAHEATLFELYFECRLSTRKIAHLYSDGENIMNYQSVNLMVNTIKSKIKNYKWKQLNS